MNIVAMRPAQPDEIPRTAAQLIRTAEAAGWTAKATYAVGVDPTSRIKKEITSIAIRLRAPDGSGALAFWWDGAFQSAVTWGPGRSITKIGSRELHAALKAAAVDAA